MASYRLTLVYDIEVDPEDEYQLDSFPEWIQEIENVEDRGIAMIEFLNGRADLDEYPGVSFWGSELEEV